MTKSTVHFVHYRKGPPVAYCGSGVMWLREGQTVAAALREVRSGFLSAAKGIKSLVLTESEADALGRDEEPSRWVAARLGLPYQKWLDVPQEEIPNVVELITAGDDDCAFDQPCRFGHRVDGHAVYCHNTRWIDAPRKCRRTWYTGGEVRDEDCPGFEPQTVTLKATKAEA